MRWADVRSTTVVMSVLAREDWGTTSGPAGRLRAANSATLPLSAWVNVKGPAVSARQGK